MIRVSKTTLIPAVIPVLVMLGITMLSPPHAGAIPAFARKFNLKCYNCHTIPPALNKTGYMFKRLGYRLPPDEMDGTKPAPKIMELENPENRFSLTNSMALVMQGSFTTEKMGGATPSSSTSFNLDQAAILAAGTLPSTNFSYFAEYDFWDSGQSSILEQAQVGYTGGRANSSYFIKGGEIHVQEGRLDSLTPGTAGAIIKNEEKCIRCGLCAQRCPTNAITIKALEQQEREVFE